MIDRILGRYFGCLMAAAVLLAPWMHAQGADKITVGLSADSISGLPFYVAKEKGIFEKNGLDVNLVVMKSDLQIAGMLSQELDFSAVTEPSILAIDKGASLKILSVYHDHHFFYLLSTESRIENLKGKKVAVSRIGSTSHKAAMDMFKNKGVDLKQITFITSQTTANSFAALQSGSVQAAILSLPSSEIARSVEGIHVLGTPSDMNAEVGDGLITSQKKINDKPDQVKRMVTSIIESLKYIKQNKVETVSLIATRWKLKPELANAVYTSVIPYINDGMMAKDKVNTFLESQRSHGHLTRKLQFADIIDERFIPKP